MDALVGLLEGLHGQVPGVGLVIGHVVKHAQEPGLVPAHEIVEGSRVPSLRALNKHAIGYLRTVRLGGFGRLHGLPLPWHVIERKGSGKRSRH